MLTERKFPILVFVFSFLISLLFLVSSGIHGQQGFPLDDAWIHMVYGRSISEGGYLAYNKGIPSTGCTSPLWAYLLGLIHLLLPKELSVIWANKLLGILLNSIMIYLFSKVIFISTQAVIASFGAALLIALCPPMVATSISGMEVTLGCTLFLAGTYAYSNNKWSLAGFLFGLSGLTRPEFAAPLVIILLDMLRQKIKQKKEFRWANFFKLLIPIFIFGLLYLGWNMLIDGRPFPATFYVKASPRLKTTLLERFVTGAYMISKHTNWIGCLIWFGLLGLPWMKGKNRRDLILFYSLGLAYFSGTLVFVAPNDPGAFYYLRYLLPAVPFFYLGLSLALIHYFHNLAVKIALKREAHGALSPKFSLFTFSIVIILLLFLSIDGLLSWKTKYAGDCRNINEVQVEIGKAISRAFPQEAVIGTMDAGAVRYFGQRFTYDLLGLNTKNAFSCQNEFDRIDALVIMQAWVHFNIRKELVSLLDKKTDNYQVTSNPLMGRQFIAVCQANSNLPTKELTLPALGRRLKVCLNCFKPEEIAKLRKLLKEQ